jgi:hypothetical protein
VSPLQRDIKVGHAAKTVVIFGTLAALGGFVLGVTFEKRRIDRISKGEHVVIDGRIIDRLWVCDLGCRHEDDVTCEKFLKMMRGR